MKEMTESQRVSSSLARTIRKLSKEVRDSESFKTDKVVALAKLTDSYEKIRKLADSRDNSKWDYEEYGNPHFVEELERQSKERAKEYLKNNSNDGPKLIKRRPLK